MKKELEMIIRRDEKTGRTLLVLMKEDERGDLRETIKLVFCEDRDASLLASLINKFNPKVVK